MNNEVDPIKPKPAGTVTGAVLGAISAVPN